MVVGLFLIGFGNGTWDVAMNVEGAAVEQRQGRSIMSRFHAGFSLGTVAGALLGSALVALHVGVDRPPHRRRGGRRRGRAALPCAASCRVVPHEHAAAHDGAPATR